MPIYPPRPKGRIDPRELPRHENGIWLAQYKYNGSRNLIHIAPDQTVAVWSRHGRKHLSYSIPEAVQKEVLALPGLQNGLEYWLDSELLNKTKAAETKNKIVLFDVLQAGKYFFMKPTQVERLKILADICGHPEKLDTGRGIGLKISDTLMMAPVFENHFADRFKDDKGDEVEGLLLRKRESVIESFGQKEYNVSWLVRCRHPHKNYNF